MNPKQSSEIGKAIGWMCGRPGKKYVPYELVLNTHAEIMPETLGRKLRDYCKVRGGIIKKTYYTNNRGTKIARYCANPKFKEKTKC